MGDDQKEDDQLPTEQNGCETIKKSTTDIMCKNKEFTVLKCRLAVGSIATPQKTEA